MPGHKGTSPGHAMQACQGQEPCLLKKALHLDCLVCHPVPTVARDMHHCAAIETDNAIPVVQHDDVQTKPQIQYAMK